MTVTNVLLSALLCVVTLASASFDYQGYQVLRTAPINEHNVKNILPWMHRAGIDFWSEPRIGHPVDILVGPELLQELWRSLEDFGLNPQVHIADVAKMVREERDEIERIKSLSNRNARNVTFDVYMTFDEILAYMDEIAATYPQLATLVEFGTSYEGRPVRGLYISNAPNTGKKAIFTDGAIHAREWLAPCVAMKIISELVENYAVNQAYVDMIDWYVLPVANPDGYTYSWTDQRFWRKTRSPNVNSTCIGTDPNRNFDFHWGEEGNTDPCSETWPNLAPWTEPEVVAMATKISGDTNIVMYMALHSYGTILIFPYGHTTDPPPTYDELFAIGTEAADAVFPYRGTQYEVGSVAVILYYSYGACRDWAYGVPLLPLSYTWELPGGGFGGFNPPPSEILPVVIETWEGIKVQATHASMAVRPRP